MKHCWGPILSAHKARTYSTAKVMNSRINSLEGRYAGALFSAAFKKDSLAKIGCEMERVKSAIDKSEELQQMLRNPTVGRNLKIEYVSKLLTKQNYDLLVVNFFKLLAENGRLNVSRKIIACFEDLLKREKGQLDVRLVVAKDPTKDQAEKLRDLINKKFSAGDQHIIMSVKVDPGIIGGIIVAVGDQTIDMSVASKLSKFQKSLM